jgi:aromatic-L-amino-acid decarboxylase
MTPDEFRDAGHRAVEWVARYLESVEELPVLARVRPGEIRDSLPPDVPDEGEPFDAILADLDALILPGLTHWQSPNFYGYFPANASGPAILGDLLSAGLGVQGMLWVTSPAATELETHVLDQLADLVGLPERLTSRTAGGGVIQDTASSATLVAMVAARERATGGRTNREGVTEPLTVYASREAHLSVVKAAGIAGIGRAQVRAIDVDERYAMRPEALAAAIEADRAAGCRPVMVCATVGTTSSTAIDPVSAIGEVCRRSGVWLHVDAALAGSAAVCPEFRWVHDGVDLADSYCCNPHKWLLTNFDCDCFYVADRAALTGALAITPEYLRNAASESGEVFDYRDWQIPLGRRFRALKLWCVLRSFGRRGLQEHIRRGVECARSLTEWVEDDPHLELAAPAPLNLVCFRHVDGDAATQAMLDRLNASGKLYLNHTRLDGVLVMRMAMGGTLTRLHHVQGAWEQIRAAATQAG